MCSFWFCCSISTSSTIIFGAGFLLLFGLFFFLVHFHTSLLLTTSWISFLSDSIFFLFHINKKSIFRDKLQLPLNRNSNVVNGGRVLYKVKRIVNDINNQTGYIDSFEMTTKNLTMEDIKEIFEKMLKEHEASIVQKDQEIFHKQQQSILALISGNNSLTNQRKQKLWFIGK